METAKARHTSTRRRPATIVLIVVAVSIATALVVGAFIADRPVYPEGSPEAAAQAYLQALLVNDEHSAHSYLAPELADDCDSISLAYPYRAADTVQFVNITTADGHAEFELEFGYSNDYEPFEIPINDPWRSPHSAQLELDQRDGTWMIVGATWIPNNCQER